MTRTIMSSINENPLRLCMTRLLQPWRRHLSGPPATRQSSARQAVVRRRQEGADLTESQAMSLRAVGRVAHAAADAEWHDVDDASGCACRSKILTGASLTDRLARRNSLLALRVLRWHAPGVLLLRPRSGQDRGYGTDEGVERRSFMKTKNWLAGIAATGALAFATQAARAAGGAICAQDASTTMVAKARNLLERTPGRVARQRK